MRLERFSRYAQTALLASALVSCNGDTAETSVSQPQTKTTAELNPEGANKSPEDLSEILEYLASKGHVSETARLEVDTSVVDVYNFTPYELNVDLAKRTYGFLGSVLLGDTSESFDADSKNRVRVKLSKATPYKKHVVFVPEEATLKGVNYQTINADGGDYITILGLEAGENNDFLSDPKNLATYNFVRQACSSLFEIKVESAPDEITRMQAEVMGKRDLNNLCDAFGVVFTARSTGRSYEEYLEIARNLTTQNVPPTYFPVEAYNTIPAEGPILQDRTVF